MQVTEGEVRDYYRSCFPFDLVRQWIQYEVKGEIQEPLEKRECAIFFEGDHFIRWAHIDQMKALTEKVSQGHRAPMRMEIGPVYSHPIKGRGNVPSGEFAAVHRELIFDIDADDFKDIRCCQCEGAMICPQCWILMECAVKCLVTILRVNFGFKQILPVFSGRRGVHVWVCDKKARELSPAVRAKIVSYMDMSSNLTTRDNPLAQQMYSICEPYFVRLITQGLFIKKQANVKKWIPEDVLSLWRDTDDEEEAAARWRQLKTRLRKGRLVPLVMSFTFPRLDAAVTATINHLLKSPFSYHPGSGLISVPIPDEKLSLFPGNWVPSLKDVVHGEQSALDTFNGCVEYFRRFVESTIADQTAP